MLLRLPITVAFSFVLFGAYCQELSDAPDSLTRKISGKYISDVSKSANHLQKQIEKKSRKTLAAMAKVESGMLRKLQQLDSNGASRLLDGNTFYQQLQEKINGSSGREYIPRLDSIATSLDFLKTNPAFLNQFKDAGGKIQEAIARVKGLETSFQNAREIRQALKERQEMLKDLLNKMGFSKQLKKLNYATYYYAAQINEYKEIVNNPKKAIRKAIQLLSRTKLFNDFMRKNSLFASLFGAADPNDPNYLNNLAGLQTRVQVTALIDQQTGTAGSASFTAIQGNLQQGMSQLDQLKQSVIGSGGSSSDDIIPTFKPNSQKTRSFFRRLEYGTNVQTQKANYLFPVTSDIGLSVGYKLNDHSIIGIGASYKLGWGKGWNNIDLSSQGMGLRTFLDWKIKGALWISGGYEKNYRTILNNSNVTMPIIPAGAWQESGLIGLSRSIPIKSKFFKKTKVQLLWDFLSYEQIPKTQPIIFRIGYNL